MKIFRTLLASLLFSTAAFAQFGQFGGGGGSGSSNATALQGTAVSGTAPNPGQCLVASAGTVWTPGTCAGGATFQANAVNLTSSATINFQSSAATNGVTITLTNPSAGNVQAGISGTLANAGLANSSIVVTTASPLGGAGTISLGGTLALTCATCGVTGTGLGQFASTTSAQLATVLSDETGSGLAVFGTSPTFLGTPNAGGATQFILPFAAGFTSAANGEQGYDTTNKNWHIWGNGVDNFEVLIPVSATITTGDCAKWNNTASVITLTDSTCTGGVSTSGSPAGNQVAIFSSSSAITGTATDSTTTHALFATAGAPAFRAIVAGDIPTLNQNTTGTASNVTGTVAIANGGTNAITAAAALINLLPAATRAGDVIYCATFSAGCTSWALLAGNNSGTQWLQETSSGVASWTIPSASSVAWSAITNGSGNLGITPGGTSIFSATTAVSQFFAFKNTTAALVGTSQSSPNVALCGTEWHASASAEGCLNFQFVPGTGTDAASTIQVTHSGSATGVVTTQLPGPVVAGNDGVHAGQFYVIGNTTLPTLPSNSFSWIAPNSASFTAYGLQPSSAAPSANNVMLVGAPTSGVSQVTYGTVPNAALTNASTTPNGQTCTLGSTCNVNNGAAAHSVALNEGAATAITGVGPGTTGQILSTTASADPTFLSFSDLSKYDYVAGGGTAQAQTATLTTPLTALVAGVEVRFLPLAANTGAGPTLAVNGLTAKSITKLGTNALLANDLLTTAIADVIYDGTQWELQNPQQVAGSSATSLSTGTTVTLTAPRQYVVCTGACTITVPVPAAGDEFCVMNDDNVATVITLSAIGSSARYENTARTAYGTAGTGTFVSSGAVGDKVCLLGRDTTHYLIASFNGNWTAN